MSRLSNTISDIENQTLKPTEIIITDAGSNDGTFEALKKWSEESKIKIIVLQKHKCNVAEGRNIAIRAASCDIIASTDFGCRFHPEWLESIISPFNNPKIKVVGGNFSVLESELRTLPERAAYVCTEGYKNKMDESFLPSSRSIAYYKNVWKVIGGYPEELTLAADDTTFAIQMKQKGFEIFLSERPLVYWLRPKTLTGYLKEAKRYATGDAESRDKKNIRNVLVNSIELVLRILLILLLVSVGIGWFPWNAITISLFLISLLGLRSFLRIFRKWWNIRSAKYHFGVLCYAFYFFDASRINYLYWYLRTFLSEPKGRLSH